MKTLVADRASKPSKPLSVEVTVSGDRKLLAKLVGRECARIWGNPASMASTAKPSDTTEKGERP